MCKTLQIKLPDWIKDVDFSKKFISDEEKMDFVIRLSKRNVEEKTGGPFGAAVFSQDNLISIGVNRVVPEACSIAHAETMALMSAQQFYQHYDLGAKYLPPHMLVTSSQMCVMCYGAVIWSGVKKVIYGANAKDVEEISGFDEGPIVATWKEELVKRGIEVVSEVMREQACEVLRHYKKSQGIIYNSRG